MKSMTRTMGWRAFYNPLAQRGLSVANFWHDPIHQEEFKSSATFLSEMNNLVPHDASALYKDNFLRVRRAVFLGSEGDDCINPQLSSNFQFVDANEAKVAMNASAVYVNDTFGLKTLHERG